MEDTKNLMQSTRRPMRRFLKKQKQQGEKTMHFNFVKATNRRYLEELKNTAHEMPVVYQSVNIMQHTEWVINKKVYEVIKTCMENDFCLGKLPINPQTIELPIKPT